MKSYIDTKTKLSMGLDPFLPFASVSAKNSKSFQVDFEKEFASMILSASGWRKVFVSSGDEEDASESIGEVNAALAVYIAESFAKYIKEATGKASPRIVIGLDARPTGTEIGQILLQVLGHRDISLEYVFISAAPEIMAYAREKDGFVYVSASHNPVGHNGIKFGLNDGGVIPGAESAKLTALFKDLCTREDAFSKAVELYESAQKTNIAALFSAVAKNKEKALASYESFTKEVISGETEASKQDAFLDLLGKSAKKTALSILVDMNGSARAISIDKSFISKLGFGFHAFNDSVRDIVHAIIPEPENLVHCAKKMEEMQKGGDSSVVLGYMPDCDGDRGNIV
ncbi:MAG TPA: phosphoglucomutase, partial [Treponemataceae bacterium]|nr:phosphoglucomutase [Treponemataceae bacterium]